MIFNIRQKGRERLGKWDKRDLYFRAGLIGGWRRILHDVQSLREKVDHQLIKESK